ncbi:lipopolysaccharide biosynthesis protein [Anaerosporobacter sp.]|uniref:lipopolysaccharide biosynthesis protein n=1 Tax=Anaerosporobacter sp. TaxID=1872529 RepID=UPI00286ED842|nr:hypothetical protein [Anaerosporobacter sp.]
MSSKKKATLLMLILAILNSGLVAIFNLIYNNLIMRNYGSDINGLISTLTQFVGLFAIIEGGFTTAAVVSIYEPYTTKNYEKLNDILYTTKRVYVRIGLIITIAVLAVGTIYLKFIDSPFSYNRTYMLLIVTVMSTSLSLCFQSKYTVLLQGVNREYIQVGISLIVKTLTWILSIVLLVSYADIIWVYGINVLNIILNIGCNRWYEKKNFQFATYKGNYDKRLIKGTGDVLFQKIANTLFTSTDLVLISSGVGLAAASVYNLYQQIFRSIFGLLSSGVQAPFNSLGHLWSEGDKQKIDYYFKMYFKITLLASTIIFTITASLIVNFVYVYTIGINDINYVRSELAILFFLQYFVQIINRPFGTMLNVTGNFAKQNVQCAVAAIANLVISIVLMVKFGISGVIFGSFIGTSIILVMNIYQCHLLVEGLKKMVFEIIVNMGASLGLITYALHLGNMATSYYEWIILAVIFSLIEGVVMYALNFALDYRWMAEFTKGIIKKIYRKRERVRWKSGTEIYQ